MALADLALAVEVPYRLRQGFDDIRSLVLQDIVDVVGRHYVRFTTLECPGNAEQAYEIGIVGVEILTKWVSRPIHIDA